MTVEDASGTARFPPVAVEELTTPFLNLRKRMARILLNRREKKEGPLAPETPAGRDK